MTTKLRIIRQKIARLAAGGKPRVLDLFAGCGGLSLGFSAAGFTIAASVEFDTEAARSHGHNFHGGDPAHSVARDITRTQPDDLVRELKLGKTTDAFENHKRLQGIAADFDLPAFTVSAKVKALGNGVPLPMGRAVARAVKDAIQFTEVAA